MSMWSLGLYKLKKSIFNKITFQEQIHKNQVCFFYFCRKLFRQYIQLSMRPVGKILVIDIQENIYKIPEKYIILS